MRNKQRMILLCNEKLNVKVIFSKTWRFVQRSIWILDSILEAQHTSRKKTKILQRFFLKN